MTKLFIGIDSGLKGGIGILGLPTGPEIYDMPTFGKTSIDLVGVQRILAHAIARAGCRPSEVVVAIEKQPVAGKTWVRNKKMMESAATRAPGADGPAYVEGGSSRKSIAAQFDNEGSLAGIPIGMGCRVVRPAPKAWQQTVAPYSCKRDVKARSMAMAQQLFPMLNFHGPRGAAMDGRSDGILLAEYARRTYGEK